MIEIYTQITDFFDLKPVSIEYRDMLKGYKPNQILRTALYGTRKQRSVLQHKWAMWMIRQVINSEDPNWDTFDKAKFRVKLGIKFFKNHVVVEGNQVLFEVDSFAFSRMPQVKATQIYNQVKDFCAHILGVEPEVLEANAKQRA